MFETIGILLCVVVLLTKSDEGLLEELWNLSQRLEERVETMEVILDKSTTKAWEK